MFFGKTSPEASFDAPGSSLLSCQEEHEGKQDRDDPGAGVDVLHLKKAAHGEDPSFLSRGKDSHTAFADSAFIIERAAGKDKMRSGYEIHKI